MLRRQDLEARGSMTASRLVLRVTLMLGLLTAPLVAETQPAGKVARVGVLGDRPKWRLPE
jgi:hypothetical protein